MIIVGAGLRLPAPEARGLRNGPGDGLRPLAVLEGKNIQKETMTNVITLKRTDLYLKGTIN